MQLREKHPRKQKVRMQSSRKITIILKLKMASPNLEEFLEKRVKNIVKIHPHAKIVIEVEMH